MKSEMEGEEELLEQHTVKFGNAAPKVQQPKLSKNASIREQLSARLEALLLDGKITKEELLEVLTKNNSDNTLRNAVSGLEALHKFGIAPEKPTEPEPEAEEVKSAVIDLEEEEVEISPLEREEAIRALNNVIKVKARPPVAEHVVSGKFEFMDLPSSYIFYNFNSVFVRPFNVGDLRRMSVAVRTLSQSMLMDIVAGCMTQDPREFTPQDFYYILYWLRSRSYPKTPMTVRWASRYGVMDDAIVNRSDFKEVRLSPENKSLFTEMHERGFDYPRMYDVESSDGLDWKSLVQDEEYDGYDWLYSRSQYFAAKDDETIIQRMKRIEVNDVSDLEEARDMMLKLKHGVEERLPVRLSASKFDPKAAVEMLETKANSLMLMSSPSPEILAIVADYKAEIKEIRETLEKGGDVKPREEFTTAPLDIRSFLSGL